MLFWLAVAGTVVFIGGIWYYYDTINWE